MTRLLLAALGIGASVLMLGGATPWNEVPQHMPPYTCAELQGFTNYAEWAHEWLRVNNAAANRDPVWEAKWVGYYKQVRPLIEAACKDVPMLPNPQEPDVAVP